jgi:hypothetical protein
MWHLRPLRRLAPSYPPPPAACGDFRA